MKAMEEASATYVDITGRVPDETALRAAIVAFLSADDTQLFRIVVQALEHDCEIETVDAWTDAEVLLAAVARRVAKP